MLDIEPGRRAVQGLEIAMILVSGGTGFVGAAVVRELLRRADHVAVLGRDRGKIRSKFGAEVEAREGDVRDPATLSPAFAGVDVGRVIADAALKPEAAGHIFEIGGPEVMSMNDVVTTALEVQGKKRRLLHQPVFLGKTIGTLSALLPSPPLTPDAIDFITEP